MYQSHDVALNKPWWSFPAAVMLISGLSMLPFKSSHAMEKEYHDAQISCQLHYENSYLCVSNKASASDAASDVFIMDREILALYVENNKKITYVASSIVKDGFMQVN